MNCFMIQKDFEKESCSISKIQIDFTKHYTKWFQNHDKKRARKMHDFLSLPSTKCVWTNFVQFQNLSFSQCENYGNLLSHFFKKVDCTKDFFLLFLHWIFIFHFCFTKLLQSVWSLNFTKIDSNVCMRDFAYYIHYNKCFCIVIHLSLFNKKTLTQIIISKSSARN